MSSPWIQTFTGKKFDLLNPEPESIDIIDIAHALSLNCRFNGHVKKFYSVAEHSYLVSKILGRTDVLSDVIKWGLLHDASEAYFTDVPRPLKEYAKDFVKIDNELMQKIGSRFGLYWPIPIEVWDADLAMLWTEKNQVFDKQISWTQTPKVIPADVKLCFWEPEEAKERFLYQFEELFDDFY